MVRPTVKHTGFLIPNAMDVTSTVLAEPDKIDFNTIANARWGVIEGCEVNPQGGNLISVAAGTAVVDGKLVKVSPKSGIQVSVPNSQFRFDLIVVNELGTVLVKPGEGRDDPVFPDPQLNETVLAAVYCSSTSSDYSNNIIDKRKFLSASLFAKMPVVDELIRNVNDTGNHYRVTGGGVTTWEDDTTLRRKSAQKLEISNDLDVVRDLYVGGEIRGLGGIKIDDYVESTDFRRGTTLPISGTPGDLFRHLTTGRLYVWIGLAAGGGWQELSTQASSVPVGTIITSLATAASLAPFGWVAMDGVTTVYENTHTGLFSLPSLVPYIVQGPYPRKMKMPDLNKRMLMVDSTGVAKTGGVSGGSVTLKIANLPSHDHEVGGTDGFTGTNGGHTPKGTITQSGSHPHTVTGGRHQHRLVDPGHRHQAAADENGVAHEIIAVWDPGGQNKLDALFNDRSHTFSVTPYWWTMPAKTNIAVSGDLSDHSHDIEGGAHKHDVDFDAVPAHKHAITESKVGSGTAFEIMPAYFTVYAYIKG